MRNSLIDRTIYRTMSGPQVFGNLHHAIFVNNLQVYVCTSQCFLMNKQCKHTNLFLFFLMCNNLGCRLNVHLRHIKNGTLVTQVNI